MQRLHARYPFLEAAREAVATAAVDLGTVVEREEAVVERARQRVITALEEGTTGEPHRDARIELLSYPVARVLVSLVDERVLVRKYARAEADRAHEQFVDDLESTTELKSVDSSGLDLAELLDEFDLADAVTERADGEYRIAVGTYLPLAEDLWDDEWRLVNRPLTDGEVPLEETELRTLLREAIRSRIEDGLPFDVPDAIADELEAEVEAVREVLADLELTREIDTVVPDLFPPCMKALLDDIQKGEHLPHHSRFAITAFLTSIGMTTDQIVDLYRVNAGFGEEMTRYQTDHIAGETSPTEYSPPSCATMQSYGDCVNKDDLCERIPHPMAYYEQRVDDADEDDLEDWRENEGEADGETASAE
ncbi:DNA primase regulatory subunit PriL [Salinadaptatus halalkaliphilus]|uniref:DNA primase large subunit PriL n=1 Tax=Salinadaptatus halalkaliphilus TaxID=2419781 RepID=A0A4S3TSP9_9EURY|nr:DNA primase regulatory subunit PriL [Salinadaptatus halalkaliphilus]THE66740.1 DNA primase regulatory subunit PriL [Salinadaptatus halalkaliphilus]